MSTDIANWKKIFLSVNQESPKPTIAGYQIDRVECPEAGGIFTYSKQLLYPIKGLPVEQIVEAIAVPKRSVIALSHILKSPLLLPSLIAFLLAPKRFKIKLLTTAIDQYWFLSELTIKPYLIPNHFFSPLPKELQLFLERLLVFYGINKDSASKLAYIIALIFEFDVAYRYRAMDIASETTKDKLLKNPIRELQWLTHLAKLRELTEGVKTKYTNLLYLTALILLTPHFRNCFKLALSMSSFNNFQYNTIERYQVLYRGSGTYLYLGLKLSDRHAMMRRLEHEAGFKSQP